MTLTVRLDATLQAALEQYCNATGASKSHVVQDCLAAYLQAAAHTTVLKTGPGAPSAAFEAFAGAGLVGGVDLAEAGSADKAAVRARVTARTQERQQAPKRVVKQPV